MLSIKDVILRPMNEDDLEMVLDWRNSEYVRKFMLTDHIIKLDEHQKWFQNTRSNPTCEWSIVEYKSTPVGVISITEIKEKDGTCSWGMYIDEKFSNKNQADEFANKLSNKENLPTFITTINPS